MTNQELINKTTPPTPLAKALLDGDEEGMEQLLDLLFSCHRLVCGMDEDEDQSNWDNSYHSWSIQQCYKNDQLTNALRNVAANWDDAKLITEQWFKDFPHHCGDQDYWAYRRDEMKDPTAIGYFRGLLEERVK